MTCREFNDLISAAVDRCLPGDELGRFDEHSRRCARCRTEYELEMTTKLVVRNHARMVSTPATLAKSISAMIAAEQTRPPFRQPGWWALLVSRPFFKPALGIGLAAVTVLVVLRSVPDEAPVDDDVISQSFTNYRAVLAGTITPQVLSERVDRVQEYFAGKTTFPVMVPRMRSCTLVGGVLNQFSGTPLAHVVYRHNGEILYLYQTCWETVQRGTPLRLPDSVQAELKRSRWYTATTPDGSSIAMWTSGRTLCAAVARMSEHDLLSCLDAPRPSPAP